MERANKRPYRMRMRGADASAREERIVEAALRLFLVKAYDQVSLQSVADAAGVSLKTVVRRFGTKEALLIACARRRSESEEAARTVTPGDAAAVAEVLARRYEAMSAVWLRFLALEDRIEAVGEVVAMARASHRAWLATAFSSVLEGSAATRKQRLAALFGATEFYVWNSWRKHLGLGRRAATRVMTDMLEALMNRWRAERGGAGWKA